MTYLVSYQPHLNENDVLVHKVGEVVLEADLSCTRASRREHFTVRHDSITHSLRGLKRRDTGPEFVP